ncbi:MAG TPA: prolyl oligopeptidase family serine peptidase, partial [Vicinamibacterales bacterium]|nr:prolyl oligopeptidase family serine peptidase [Vicinamibacterales bacterium]
MTYPKTPLSDVVDEYHGVKVPDPYRWLEQLDSPEVKAWVEAQNALSVPFLEQLPGRKAMSARLTELWNYERYGMPFEEGGRYFYSFNPGLANQDLIYVAESLSAEPRVLIDPNKFSDDGTVALAGLSISPDGRIAAYAKSDGGSDWRDWFFRDVETGADLSDRLTFTKFTGLSWARDGSGVYYSRYPAGPNGRGDDTRQVSIWFHKLGTPQSEDRLVYDVTGAPKHRNLEPNVYGYVTEDGRYLVITVQAGYHENLVRLLDLEHPEAGVRPIIDEWKALYGCIGNDGPVLYFETTDNAPNSRVIAIDVRRPDPAHWREIVPEAPEALESATYVGGYVVARYLKDAKSQVKIYDRNGAFVREVELPGIGTAAGFHGHIDRTETFFSFTSFTTPGEVYRYDVATGERTLFKRSQVAGFDQDAYETKQVFYTSKDGTRVPMFIVHRKGIPLDGSTPTLLYGYGGFNVSMTPEFRISRAIWLEMGGIFAMPNLRGGGEYGKAWHLAGTKDRKQNVFDDFIAAAEWLIANRYTSTPKLAIHGGSNGGLLVAACMLQRPDLFGAVLPAVGVLDMLRYHLPSANARNWSTDYGLPENE